MSEMIRVAIDGPSGAGKSTIAKAVAKALNIDYIDTGSMYRAVAYKTISNDIDPQDGVAMQAMLDETEIDFSQGNIILDGAAINGEIRTDAVAKRASQCSALPAVREKLVQLQRRMGQKKSVIMDGRDIGNNVLPDAEHKFFMTASPQARARRRYEELSARGQDVNYGQVLSDIEQRDHNDMTRKLNPLRKAPDALEVDTTELGIEEVTDLILKEIRK